ncbi:hypothetical protein GCM10007392_41270 [Saccharospirillum salsuginis]|uniref:Uncharacterized protein n=1 Tax=Saccharospirillum salsuginis TaxID=418750 RepID=A0A918KN56_9GAMM|nr:hypothetical protein GCM10007392_41270 [Saccharospirillum salsuginis]
MATALGGLAKRLVREELIGEEEALAATQDAVKEKRTSSPFWLKTTLLPRRK